MKTIKKPVYLILMMVFALSCEDPPDIVPLVTGSTIPAQCSNCFEATIQLQLASIHARDFIPQQVVNVQYKDGGDSFQFPLARTSVSIVTSVS